MKTMKKIITTLCFTIISAGMFAQITFVKGYLVTLNGDTIKGEIKMNPKKEFDLFNKVFLKDESGVQKNYKPDKVKAYGFEDKHFVAAKYEGEMMFYKILSSGKITLYEIMYEMQQMNDIVVKSEYYLAAKSSGEFEKLKQNKYKKQLSEFMKDNPDIISGDEEKKFEIEKVTDLIQQYNNWAKNN